MGTFCRRIQLSRFLDLDSLLRLVSWSLSYILYLLHNIIAFQDLSEDNMLSIQPAIDLSSVDVHILDPIYSRSYSSGDEELRSIRVLAGVGHTKHASLAVLQLEVLIREFLAVDGLSAST